MAGSDDAAFVGTAITFVGVLLAAVIGVTQFPDARLFVCNQLSLLCDRENDVALTYVDFVNGGDVVKTIGRSDPLPSLPDEMYGDAEGWNALMSLKDFDKRTEPQCLADHRGAELQGGVEEKDDLLKYNKSQWQFYNVLVDSGIGMPSYLVQENRTLLVDIISKYPFPLKRNIEFTIDIDDIRNNVPITDPRYRGHYVFTHPEGTDSYWVECELYYQGLGFHQFRIRFTDDFYHTDQTQTIGVMVATPPPP